MKTYNIIIVDSKAKYRKDIKEYLEMQFNCSIIAEASNGESFLRLGEIIDRADIVLMDIGVIKNAGQLLVQRLMLQYPKTKIITIVNPEDYYYLVSLMFLNIREIVYKSMFFSDVIPALKRVLNGETMKREVTVSEMSSILFN